MDHTGILLLTENVGISVIPRYVMFVNQGLRLRNMPVLKAAV